MRASRLFQDFVLDSGELSPNYVRGKGVHDAVERADDLQKGANPLCVGIEELVKSSEAQRQIYGCCRSHQAYTTRASAWWNDFDRLHRVSV